VGLLNVTLVKLSGNATPVSAMTYHSA
jgi:hypothetical protein